MRDLWELITEIDRDRYFLDWVASEKLPSNREEAYERITRGFVLCHNTINFVKQCLEDKFTQYPIRPLLEEVIKMIQALVKTTEYFSAPLLPYEETGIMMGLVNALVHNYQDEIKDLLQHCIDEGVR